MEFGFLRSFTLGTTLLAVTTALPAAVPQPGNDVSHIACQIVWPIDADLENYLDHMVTMGIDTARCDMMWWGLIEPTEGVYNWDGSTYPGWEGWDVDNMIALMNARDIEPYVVLGLGNAVYDPAPNGIDWVSPDSAASRTAFANYCAAAAARYKDDIHYWEIWNEPNLSLFWGGTPNAADYTALVAAAAPVVRANDPDSIIIGGVTSGIDNGYLNACFQEGLLDYIDVVSIHPYRTSAPETIASELQTLRNNIAANTSKDIEIWTGEWGYNTFYSEVDPIGQGKSLARMMINNQVLDIDLSVWFSIHAFQELDPSGTDDEWGLLTRSLTSRPSYYAMQTMNTYFDEPVEYVDDPFLADLSGSNSQTRIETFSRNGGTQYVVAVWSTAWPAAENTNTTPRTLTLDISEDVASWQVVSSLDGSVYTGVSSSEGINGELILANYPYADFPTLAVIDIEQAGADATVWMVE